MAKSRKGSSGPGRESSDAATGKTGVAAHIAAVAAAAANTPPPSSLFGNPYTSLSSPQQLSFVDPNVAIMTNAAATIAAVAASAVQHMAREKASSVPSAHSGAHGMSHGALVAALQHDARKPPPSSSLHPHVAALLGGRHSLPYPSSTGSLHRALNPGESATLHPAITTASMNSGSNTLLPHMHTWSADQLENHVKLLRQLNQPVPHSVALLLADAKRKEKKKSSKRVANRKSASTSRARKKAIVEEMTKTNARLRRQALILALLPDLVIAISTEGEITFCSAQVERVLQHDIDDLIGGKLHNLLAPASRDEVFSLIEELVSSEKSNAVSVSRRGTKRRLGNQRDASDTTTSKTGGETGKGNSTSRSSRSAGHSVGRASAAAIVSDQSFPLSVVEVESKQSARPSRAPTVATVEPAAEPHENSDISTSNGEKQPMSSLTNDLSRSPTASSLGDDDAARGGSRGSGSARAAGSGNGKRLPSSDDSSLSSDAKNMRTANENLDRNVRWHNQRIANKANCGPKDDVTGASVTANNATARLSSLKHVPEPSKAKEDKSSRYESTGEAGDQSSSDDSLLAGVEEKKKGENASDDSGYRESNDSREETSSSGSDTSNSNDHRKKPLAPARRMCLIRKDLTTVWCEVTSSIRTRSPDEDSPEPTGSKSSADATPKPQIKELLLCLRPIRDGDKVDEALRFVSQKDECLVSSSSGDAMTKEDKPSSEKNTTSSGSGGSNSNSANSSRQSEEKRTRPAKKRPLPSNGESLPAGEEEMLAKRKKANPEKSHKSSHNDPEKSVAESLMLMNKLQ